MYCVYSRIFRDNIFNLFYGHILFWQQFSNFKYKQRNWKIGVTIVTWRRADFGFGTCGFGLGKLLFWNELSEGITLKLSLISFFSIYVISRKKLQISLEDEYLNFICVKKNTNLLNSFIQVPLKFLRILIMWVIFKLKETSVLKNEVPCNWIWIWNSIFFHIIFVLF